MLEVGVNETKGTDELVRRNNNFVRFVLLVWLEVDYCVIIFVRDIQVPVILQQ